MAIDSIKICLTSPDPLSDMVFEYFLNYKEEDLHIDYKETFDNSEREWIEITKDVMSLNFKEQE